MKKRMIHASMYMQDDGSSLGQLTGVTRQSPHIQGNLAQASIVDNDDVTKVVKNPKNIEDMSLEEIYAGFNSQDNKGEIDSFFGKKQGRELL